MRKGIVLLDEFGDAVVFVDHDDVGAVAASDL